MPPRNRVNRICVICGIDFEVVWYRLDVKKTCSRSCLASYRSSLLKGNTRATGHTPNATCFQPGLTPWNKGTVGVMQVNSGSFQIGRECEAKQPLGTTTIRKDKQGHDRAWVKITENGNSYDWIPRAVLIWEDANGHVPDKMIIHHKDRNTLNDMLYNLELMDRAGHLMEHRHEFEKKRKYAIRQSNRIKRATTSETTGAPQGIL